MGIENRETFVHFPHPEKKLQVWLEMEIREIFSGRGRKRGRRRKVGARGKEGAEGGWG